MNHLWVVEFKFQGRSWTPLKMRGYVSRHEARLEKSRIENLFSINQNDYKYRVVKYIPA